MRYEVFLTDDALRDLEDPYDYNDAPAKAEHVLDRIEHAIETLSRLPQRGSVPRELQGLGMREYRQIFFKPHRVIYRTIDRRVYVVLIADGRRDMQSLLARRLLGA